MASTQIGAAAVNFGTKDEAWGYVENLQVGERAEKLEIANGGGDIVSAIYHGKKEEISGSFTRLAASGPAAADPIGSSVAFKTEGSATIDAHIDQADTTYKRADVTTVDFQATRYPDLVTTTTTTTTT